MSSYSEIRPQAARQGLFETPIAHLKLQNSDQFVADMKKLVLAKRDADPEGVGRSNVGGWHSDVDMMQWGGAPAQKLADTAIAVAKRMSTFPGASHDDYHWLIQMWANVSPPGASNFSHVHPGNLWSGACYIDMGGAEERPELGGAFYFEDPRFPLVNMHNTRFRFANADGSPMQVMPEVRPGAGEILMFPAWLRHGVKPYMGNDLRISVAFNIDAVLK